MHSTYNAFKNGWQPRQSSAARCAGSPGSLRQQAGQPISNLSWMPPQLTGEMILVHTLVLECLAKWTFGCLHQVPIIQRHAKLQIGGIIIRAI